MRSHVPAIIRYYSEGVRKVFVGLARVEPGSEEPGKCCVEELIICLCRHLPNLKTSYIVHISLEYSIPLQLAAELVDLTKALGLL